MSGNEASTGLEIAVVAVAGRFPGANNVEEYWQNLRAGLESISRFEAQDLVAAGVDPSLLDRPGWVPAAGYLEGYDRFDAGFFECTPREAEILDPQQRLFLECAWEVLERAGHMPEIFPGLIGVYGGAKFNDYLVNLFSNPEIREAVGDYALMVASDRDYLTTRVSYKLGLKGPSVAIQTACSTSLVAVHMACQGLLAGECDMALAGGVSLALPYRWGYPYTDGGVFSPDGHCRAFDAGGQGTVAGSGLGLVALRRLQDALDERDSILAVIKGSAINNDGDLKIGFTAPSVEGQIRVIRSAQEIAEVDPSTVSYVECHGTATPLGDPIEIEALTRAFRARTDASQFCAIGSVKTNIGHLDPAAGIAGLIKTVLMLEHGEVPPSLHFETPNPRTDLETSPFFVNTASRPWNVSEGKRRAGVSSFGIGGTNAHVVLEEAPERPPSGPSRPWQLIGFSARSEATLSRLETSLGHEFASGPKSPECFADAAFTLHVGRRNFEYRRFLVCQGAEEAAEILLNADPRRLLSRRSQGGESKVAFLFPGQGSQYPGMAAAFYETEPVFRSSLDAAAEILTPILGIDLRPLLVDLPKDPQEWERASETLMDTALAQPALVAFEVALARLWQSWGVEPAALAGHSIGEYTAAHLAGVFDLEAVLTLVAERGQLMARTERGAMLGASCSVDRLESLGLDDLSIAAVNGEEDTVISGVPSALEALGTRLAAEGISHRVLKTSHAFHSDLMEPILAEFEAAVRRACPAVPHRVFYSNLTGRIIEAEEAAQPKYWVRHLRNTVKFGETIRELWQTPRLICLEVGPGAVLSGLCRRNGHRPPDGTVISSLPSFKEKAAGASGLQSLLTALGRLWAAGCRVDWSGFYCSENRQRVLLPTYPFERERYWVDGQTLPAPSAARHDLEVSSQTGQDSPATPNEDGEKPAIEPAGASNRPSLETPWVSPRTELEAVLARVWQDSLGISPIGIHDNYFELGGSSLLATRLVARLVEKTGRSLALSELLGYPTIAGLAELLAERQPVRDSKSPAEALPKIVPDELRRHEPFRLTDVQQAYWIGRSGGLDLGNVSTHAYVELDCRGLDLDRLTRALRKVIARQDMLRAVFTSDGQQQILEQVPSYEIRLQDLRRKGKAEIEDDLLAVRQRMSHQVLDSTVWPLFEVAAARLEEDRYRLFFSFDFLLGDAWSLEILGREISAFYRAPDLQLHPLHLSFRDYVLAEETISGSPAHETALNYWRSRSETMPGGPELPQVKALDQITSPLFVRRHGTLPAETWEVLKQRASSCGLTPSSLLASAFSEVLNRWASSPNFTLSLTLFNRLPLHTQVNDLIGDFTSVVLLERDGEGEHFQGRAQRLQRRLWEDLDHRLVSGVQVIREMAKKQGRAGTKSFPVVFTSLLGMAEEASHQADDLDRTTLNGVAWESEPPQAEVVFSISQTPQVILDHQVEEREGGLSYNWDAVDEVFPDRFLDDLFSAYRTLLGWLADESDWTKPLPHLLPERDAQVLAEFNATVGPAAEATLHGLFEDRARRSPRAVAVVGLDRQLTYQELDEASKALATELLRKGAKPGTLVAVFLQKGWRQAIAALGIVRAGCAYLPIASDLPTERRNLLLAQGKVDVVVTSEDLARGIEWPASVRASYVDGMTEEQVDEETPLPTVPASDLAYVIFTSGSTGLPKGVMIDHRGAVNTILDVNHRFSIGEDDRALAISALGFDLSVYDLFGLWAAGGTTVYPEPWSIPDPQGWAQRVAAEEVTVWNTVPALMEMTTETASGQSEPLLKTLKRVLLSGDWIPVQLPARIRELSPMAEVISLGGATEASIWSIYHSTTAADAHRRSIPYGRPLGCQTFHVLDENLRPRPLGVAGDLYIGGKGLALGYWGDQERTAEAFIQTPTLGRLYRTGDRGRLLDDGEIEFLGRVDLQVKIHGHRIELGEIEAHLNRLEQVEAAVAGVVGDISTGGRRLAAWVVLTRGVEPNTGVLRRQLEALLPAYMVPKDFVLVSELPLSSNGKVDRKALPAPTAVASRDEELKAPGRPASELLASLAAGVLGLPEAKPEDNFFALGGHSLLATTLISRVRDAFGIELALRDVFEATTLDALARVVEGARRRSAHVEMPPVLPAGTDTIALTFAQKRLWFLKQIALNSPVYNVNLGIDLQGSLDLEILQRSLDEIVRRHEILRVAIPARDGSPDPHLMESSSVPIYVVDLATLVPSEKQVEAQALIDTAFVLPIPVDICPLLRVYIFRHAPHKHVFLGMTHHIIWDDWSEGIFWFELGSLYRAFQAGKPSPLEELPIQYSDYAAWQLNWFESEVNERQLAYWLQQLEGAPAQLELPTDRPRPIEQSFRGLTAALPLHPRFIAELGEFGRSHGATLFMVLVTAFKALLARLSGQVDFSIGTLVGNRSRPETEPLIGFFVNTLVLRTNLDGSPSFLEALHRVREVALGAYDHQDYPLEKLMEELHLRRDLGYNPLTQAVFNQFSAGRREVSLPGLKMTGISGEVGWAPFDVAFTLLGDETQPVLHSQFASDLFDKTTMDRWLRAMQRLLASGMAEPRMSMSELSFFSAAELHQLSFEWRGDLADSQPMETVVDLFLGSLSANADAVAVVSEHETHTYRELADRACALAGALVAAGVLPDQPVALGLDRSVDMVTGLLATILAGGAYLPLDPTYPDSRLAFMMEDSGAKVLLLQESLRSRFEDLAPPDSEVSLLVLEEVLAMPKNGARPLEELPGVTSITPDHLCYVVYTSGSTGRPKGVGVPHRGVVGLLRRSNFFTLSPGQRTAVLSNAGFDALTFEVWGPLVHGAAMVMLESEDALSVQRMRQVLDQHQVDTMFLTAAVFCSLVNEDPSLFGDLRQVYFGGEASDPKSVAAVLDSRPPEALFHVYGPTETTTFATFERVDEVSPYALTVPIGRPVTNSLVDLVSPELLPVPVGGSGEIMIGGAKLARGYLARPALTAERFIPDPFSKIPGQRLYRTGDRGRFLADGRVEFQGRFDHQVKLRGFRIELGEVESFLVRYPEVTAAVVLVRELEAGNKQLVAYYEAPTDLAEPLAKYLAEHLPAYMVPWFLMHLEKFPLTANGKIDRGALPDLQAAAGGKSSRPATGALEASLLEIWRQVLGNSQIGVDDNFFDLGGDSILTIQITARAQEQGIPLSPNLLFRLQTVAELASHLENDDESGQHPAYEVYEGSAPLLPIQHYFFDLGLAVPAHFNHVLLFQVPPEVQGETLRRVLHQLAAIHDVLRVRFVEGDDGWRQEFRPLSEGAAAAKVREVEKHASSANETASWQEEVSSEDQGGLNLQEGPLLIFTLLKAGGGFRRLHVVAHHLVVDGVSWRILLRDLDRALAAELGRGRPLPEGRSLSLGQWARELRELAQDDRFVRQLDGWVQAASVSLELPVTDSSAANLAGDAGTILGELGEEETQSLLQEVHGVYGTRIEELLAVALSRALRGWTEEERVGFWLERHGREVPGLEGDLSRTVGWFTSRFPVALTLSRTEDLEQDILAVKETLRRIPDQGIGFGLLRYLCQEESVRRAFDGLTGPPVALNYLGQIDTTLPSTALLQLVEGATGPAVDPSNHRDLLLEVDALVTGGCLRVRWTFGEKVLSRSSIESLNVAFMSELREILAHCQSRGETVLSPSDFPAADLSQDELDNILSILE